MCKDMEVNRAGALFLFSQEFGQQVAEKIYGDEGPDDQTTITDLEDEARIAMLGVLDGTIARAAELKYRHLPEKLPCSNCGRECEVTIKKRPLRTRLGMIEMPEPSCYCSTCRRAFFPASRDIAT